MCPSREALEIQEYRELLGNQESLEIQETQYVLAKEWRQCEMQVFDCSNAVHYSYRDLLDSRERRENGYV